MVMDSVVEKTEKYEEDYVFAQVKLSEIQEDEKLDVERNVDLRKEFKKRAENGYELHSISIGRAQSEENTGIPASLVFKKKKEVRKLMRCTLQGDLEVF